LNIDIVYYLNITSRFALLAVTAYKAHTERKIEWMYICLMSALAAFTPEPFLLKSLGLHLNEKVAHALDMVGSMFQGVLAMLAALYVKDASPPVEKRAIPVILGTLAYLWIVVTNAIFNPSFILKTAVPVAVYSLGYAYLGYTILKYSPLGSFASRLFAYSMILLALLNATYPYTVTLEWFRSYGFALGTLLRYAMTVGAFGVAFWPSVEATHAQNASRGTVVVTPPEGFKLLIEEIGKKRSSILVTRNDLRQLELILNSSAMVFWITRVTDGELKKKPHIYAISPTRLGILLDLIARALEAGYNTVYIDSIEYLILENGFNTVLRFLLSLKDWVTAKGGELVLCVDPTALDEKQLKILEREFGEIRGQASL